MEELYTVNQTAIILKVHPLTVRRYIKEGKLKAYRAAGSVRVSSIDLKSFVQTLEPLVKHSKSQVISPSKQFSFSDPLFNLRGKGLSVGKINE